MKWSSTPVACRLQMTAVWFPPAYACQHAPAVARSNLGQTLVKPAGAGAAQPHAALDRLHRLRAAGVLVQGGAVWIARFDRPALTAGFDRRVCPRGLRWGLHWRPAPLEPVHVALRKHARWRGALPPKRPRAPPRPATQFERAAHAAKLQRVLVGQLNPRRRDMQLPGCVWGRGCLLGAGARPCFGGWEGE